MIRVISASIVALLSVFQSSCDRGEFSESEKLIRTVKPAVVIVQATVEAKPLWESETGPRRLEVVSTGRSGTGFIYHPEGYVVTKASLLEDLYASEESLASMLREKVLERDIYPTYEKQMGRRLSRSQREQIRIMLRNSLTLTPVRKLTVGLSNGSSYEAGILEYGPTSSPAGKDIALLKIEARQLPTATIGDSQKVRIQNDVMVIGYPEVSGGQPPSSRSTEVTAGKISSLTPYIMLDANLGENNSGGVVFNTAGEIIGLATVANVDTRTLNTLIPEASIFALIRKVGIQPARGRFDQLWAEAQELYEQGKFKAASMKCDDILRILPEQPDVRELQTKALEIRESMWVRIREDLGWMIYAGAAVLVLLALFSVTAVRKSRRKAGPTASKPQLAATRMESAATPKPTAEPPKSYGSILCTAGELNGSRFSLDSKGLLIGRDISKCQIVLNNDVVSKEHAWIVPLNEGIFVIDNGSSNGTFINTTESPRISKVRLNHGDKIFVGKKGVAVFTYQSY